MAIDFVVVSKPGNSCNGNTTDVASLLLVGVLDAPTEVEIDFRCRAEICDTGDGVVYNFEPFSIFDTDYHIAFRDMVHRVAIAAVGGRKGGPIVASPFDDLRADGVDAGLEYGSAVDNLVVNGVGMIWALDTTLGR